MVCLQYDSEARGIQHCEANLLEQQFNVFRVEDKLTWINSK